MKKLIFSISFLLLIISLSTETFATCSSLCGAQGGTCRGSTLPAPTAFNTIANPRDSNSHNYHTKNVLLTNFTTLFNRYPGFASYEPVGKSYEGRDIVLFKIGNPNGGKVLWVGEMHGWEDAGSEIQLLIAKWLLENGTTGIDPTAQRIIQQNLIMFMPVINMDSYERQNVNFTDCVYGIDLNRNFVKGWYMPDEFKWDYTCYTQTKCSSTANCSTYYPNKGYVCKYNNCTDALHYPGSSRSSEKETQALRSVFQTYKPKFFFDIHYGGYPNLMYYNNSPSNYTLTKSIIARINQLSSQRGVTPYPTTNVGDSGQSVGDASAYASAWLLEVANEGGRTDCSCYMHTCHTYNDIVNIYYPKLLPIFLAMTEASANSTTTSTCLPTETNIGQDDCSSGNVCCCSQATTCTCGSWTNGACNAGSCVNQRQQTRTCTPTGCNITTQCIADSSCVSTGGLVGYWKFDGNALDSSGSNNNGIFYGETFNDGKLGDGTCAPGSESCPSRVSGYFSNALKFDGTNDYISVSDSNSLDLTNSLTITAWIRPINWGPGGMGRIVDKNSSYMFYVYNSGSTTRSLSFYYWSGTSTNQVWSNKNVLTLNAWQHVAVTYDGQYVKFYVNGTLAGQTTKTGNIALSSSSLYLGNRFSFDRAFNGTLDEVRILNRALTQTEIQAEMQSSMPITKPAASWNFEEANSAKYVNDTHNWIKGKTNSALSFDGINDYVRIRDSSSLDMASAITISAWIYPSSWPSSYPRIVSKEVSTSANPYTLELDNSSKRAIFCLDVGTGEKCVDSGINSISLNNWYYVAGTWDGGYSRIYINGVLKNSMALSGSMSATSNDVLIGSNPSGNRQFAGIIDGVKIYNYALAGSEITSAYSLPAFTLPYVLGVNVPIISLIFVILMLCLFLAILTLMEKLKLI